MTLPSHRPQIASSPAGFCLRDFFAAAENLWGLFAQATLLFLPHLSRSDILPRWGKNDPAPELTSTL